MNQEQESGLHSKDSFTTTVFTLIQPTKPKCNAGTLEYARKKKFMINKFLLVCIYFSALMCYLRYYGSWLVMQLNKPS